MADEIYISTDIDNLIRVLKIKKSIELNDLAKQSGLSIRDVEKWVKVLEEQGLVRIGYKLTKMYVDWLGAQDVASKPTKTLPVVSAPQPHIVAAPKSGHLTADKLVLAKTAIDNATHDEAEDILKKKLENLLSQAEEVKKASEEIEAIASESEPSFSVHDKSAERRSYELPPDIAELSEQLKAKMREINDKAHEIAELKHEKETLLHESYLPISQRLETELSELEEKLTAKETQIMKLRQRGIEVPDQISEVELTVLKLRDAEEEARRSLHDTTSKISQAATTMHSLETGVMESVNEAKRKMESEAARLKEMEQALNQLDELEKQTKSHIEDARSRISDESQRISEIEARMKEMHVIADEVRAKVEETDARLSQQKDYVGTLESEVAELQKIDNWINSYQREYETKFESFAQYVRETENDFNSLRETIETGFVRKYLKELKDISDGHAYEVKQVLQKEDALNKRSDSAKRDLSRLIGESKDISEHFEHLLSAYESGKPIPDRIKSMESRREGLERKFSDLRKDREKVEDDIAPLFEKE